jgi:hypothetical protein
MDQRVLLANIYDIIANPSRSLITTALPIGYCLRTYDPTTHDSGSTADLTAAAHDTVDTVRIRLSL